MSNSRPPRGKAAGSMSCRDNSEQDSGRCFRLRHDILLSIPRPNVFSNFYNPLGIFAATLVALLVPGLSGCANPFASSASLSKQTRFWLSNRKTSFRHSTQPSLRPSAASGTLNICGCRFWPACLLTRLLETPAKDGMGLGQRQADCYALFQKTHLLNSQNAEFYLDGRRNIPSLLALVASARPNRLPTPCCLRGSP